MLTLKRHDHATQAVQSDKQTLCLRLRTMDSSTWLYLCWHPVSGRICTGPSPDRGAAAEAFSFGEDLLLVTASNNRSVLFVCAHFTMGIMHAWYHNTCLVRTLREKLHA